MAKIISIANNKGGVAKTTTAVQLAQIWAMKGYRILLVDLDAQANLSAIFYDGEVDRLESTVLEFMALPVEPPILHVRENIDLIPSNLSLSTFEQNVNSYKMREFLLKDALAKCESMYDVILIDCPPALNLLTYNALIASNFLVIPVTADSLSYRGLKMMTGLVREIKGNPRLNGDLRPAGVIVTRYKSNKVQNAFLEELREDAGRGFVEPPVRERTNLQQATDLKKSIFEYDPNSPVAEDYRKVADELERRIFLK